MLYKEVFQQIKNLILNEDHWTQSVYARNSQGQEVLENADDACQWCLLGAMYKILYLNKEYLNNEKYVLDQLYNKVKTNYHTTIASFNDAYSHKEVIALLDEIIQECED